MARKQLKGTIVSTSMDKTVVVAVEMPKLHRLYRKRIKNTRRFKVRTDNKYNLGDLVTIEETKPFSKTVSWVIVKNLSVEGK